MAVFDPNRWNRLKVKTSPGDLNPQLVTSTGLQGQQGSVLLQIATNSTFLAQQWQLFSFNTSHYVLRAANSGPLGFLGLIPSGDEVTPGKTLPVMRHVDISDISMFWQLNTAIDGTFSLKNAANGTGLLLTAKPGSLIVMDSKLMDEIEPQRFSVEARGFINDARYSSVNIPTSILKPTPPTTPPPPATSSPISKSNHTSNTSFISTIAGIFGALGLVLLLVITCIFIQRQKRRRYLTSFARKSKAPLVAKTLDISGPINVPKTTQSSTSISVSEKGIMETKPGYEPKYKTHYITLPSSPTSSISSPRSLGYGHTPPLTPRSPYYNSSSALVSGVSRFSEDGESTPQSPKFPDAVVRNPGLRPLPFRMETTPTSIKLTSSVPRRPNRPPPLREVPRRRGSGRVSLPSSPRERAIFVGVSGDRGAERRTGGEGRGERSMDTPPLSPSASFRMELGKETSTEGLGAVEERDARDEGKRKCSKGNEEGRGNENIRRHFNGGVRRSKSQGGMGGVGGEGGWL